MTDLSVVEICAGAGGQSLGLHLAGFHHKLAVELDPTAAETLKTNLDRLALAAGSKRATVAVGDVADGNVWSPEQFDGVSLLAGGVPCPPFTIAGKQLGSDDERDLFAWAVESVGRVRPAAVMLENVRGLWMPRFAAYRQAVLDRLNELGYVAEWRLLEARHYGVPQLRPRTILVALLPEFAPYFRWPEPELSTETVGTALRDLMAERGWRGVNRWVKKANDIAPTIVGGSKKHGGADLGPTRARRAWAELGVNGISLADEAPGRELSAAYVPRLTTEMVARLQGWHGSEDYAWEFTGRKTSRYRQIGNAFPPPVARAVGTAIASALRKEHIMKDSTDAKVTHSPVYGLLRANPNRFVPVGELLAQLADVRTADQVTRDITFLRRDFDLDEQVQGGQLAYRLGGWRAFQGEAEHARHVAFNSGKGRARIS
ncbi:MAG: DNA cytosine methyltransferase [Nakamurella sp.]